MDLETANLIVGVGTVLLNLGAIVLFAVYLKPTLAPRWFMTLIERSTLWGLFAMTLIASATTLYYSEVLGAVPCAWCWMQRVFLYPQVIIFAIAAVKRDVGVWGYAVGLSLAGAIIALYQHYLQMGGYDIVPCPATGSHVDCAVRTMFEFGYITYPFMAFSLFIFIVLLMLVLRNAQRSHTATLE